MDFKKRFGKNYVGIYASPYDERDYSFNELIPKGAVKIPKKYVTPMPNFVYDQGSSSECAACAYSTIRYLQESDVKSGGSGIDQRFSPSFTYANRIKGEDFEGMYLRSVCKKGREGSIPWSVFPGFYSYNECKTRFIENKYKWLKMAKPFRISSFYQCKSREQIQQAIMECKAVLGGIYLLDCIIKVGSDGIVYYDKGKDISNCGTHAIVIIGWKTDKEGKLWYKAINSWGRSYGKNGTMWIPEEFPWLENPWAIVDHRTKTKWDNYRNKYNL